MTASKQTWYLYKCKDCTHEEKVFDTYPSQCEICGGDRIILLDSSQTPSSRKFIEDLGNGVLLEMIAIPRGRFLMGSPKTEKGSYYDERPQHQVEIAPFHTGRYLVTQAQYQAVMGENPSYFKGENNPVERVSWYKAKEFCQKLSEQTGKTYQLPSEAQWEYACRAGTTTPFYFGKTISTDLANYHGNYTYGNEKEGVYRRKTTPVGSFPPNAFGLYDMHGNVWEWCLDNWHNSYEGAPTDGRLWLDGNHTLKVLRGGSWNYPPENCRSASRLSISPGSLYGPYGFRVVCGVTRTL